MSEWRCKVAYFSHKLTAINNIQINMIDSLLKNISIVVINQILMNLMKLSYR